MRTHLHKKTTTTNTKAAAHQQKGKALEDNRPKTVIQQQKNNTGMPDHLKSGIENLSGHSLDDVRVHYNSSKPAQLNAHAYAQGNNIHLASGQERHLPHEAWHVVQQKQGRVQPTTTVSGAKVNDNPSLEKEADIMGGKAMQFKATIQKKSLESSNYAATIQLGKKKETPAQKLAKLRALGVVTRELKTSRAAKLRPKDASKYGETFMHGGRTYYIMRDANKRVTKFAAKLHYYKGKRIATPRNKVPYIRKNDQAGHLIAHSLGGPPKLLANFVAMDKTINGKSGAWAKMEEYIRTRLKQKNIKVWMSVKPNYPGKKKRPDHIEVSLTFNRSPYKVGFDVPTP
ncbi:MAG: DNA/RNA non-specific endonuclease [Bacteroidota bacterium]